MKRSILALLSAVLLLASCATKADKTIESLKAAATGESNASAHYAQFSAKAYEEGYANVGNMFAATSYAESLHAAKHLEELAKLGVKDFVPVVTPAEVKTTLENLKEAVAGETYEFTEMYPGFMTIATEEKQNGAYVAFEWANRAEIKHAGFYTVAITDIMNNGSDANVTDTWVVCSKCGDTYMQSEMPQSCELCGTASELFKVFKR